MLITRCKITRYSLQKLLVAKNHSVLVAEVTCCKKSFVTRCKIYLLLLPEVARCKKLLAPRYEKIPETDVYLKPIKIVESDLYILYFQLTKNREKFRIQQK